MEVLFYLALEEELRKKVKDKKNSQSEDENPQERAKQ